MKATSDSKHSVTFPMKLTSSWNYHSIQRYSCHLLFLTLLPLGTTFTSNCQTQRKITLLISLRSLVKVKFRHRSCLPLIWQMTLLNILGSRLLSYQMADSFIILAFSGLWNGVRSNLKVATYNEQLRITFSF